MVEHTWWGYFALFVAGFLGAQVALIVMACYVAYAVAPRTWWINAKAIDPRSVATGWRFEKMVDGCFFVAWFFFWEGFDFEYESTGDPMIGVFMGEQRCLFDDLIQLWRAPKPTHYGRPFQARWLVEGTRIPTIRHGFLWKMDVSPIGWLPFK